jgi:hypothetical protein
MEDAMHVNSYDPLAKTPKVGSRWVWEIDLPHAVALVEVTEVKWNGEEWWVWSKPLLIVGGSEAAERLPAVPNDLSRFMEAVTPVGGTTHSLLEERSAIPT